MSRPKFYDGQPVVCVTDWPNGIYPGAPVPQKGKKYVVHTSLDVRHIRCLKRFDFMVELREIPGRVYDQNGFAPITDGLVREIIAEAHEKTRKLETTE